MSDHKCLTCPTTTGIMGTGQCRECELKEVVQCLRSELREANDRAKELDDLFDIQQKRMGEAIEAWRSERPGERMSMSPDLGTLLAWLLARAVLDAEGRGA